MSEIVINSVLPDQFHEIRNVAPPSLAPVAAAAERVADALLRAAAARQTNTKRESGFPPSER